MPRPGERSGLLPRVGGALGHHEYLKQRRRIRKHGKSRQKASSGDDEGWRLDVSESLGQGSRLWR